MYLCEQLNHFARYTLFQFYIDTINICSQRFYAIAKSIRECVMHLSFWLNFIYSCWTLNSCKYKQVALYDIVQWYYWQVSCNLNFNTPRNVLYKNSYGNHKVTVFEDFFMQNYEGHPIKNETFFIVFLHVHLVKIHHNNSMTYLQIRNRNNMFGVIQLL